MPEPQEYLRTDFVPRPERELSEVWWQGFTIGFCVAVLGMMAAGMMMLP